MHQLCANMRRFSNNSDERLRWSRGSVLPLSTQACGFRLGQSRQDFSGWKKSSALLPSEGK